MFGRCLYQLTGVDLTPDPWHWSVLGAAPGCRMRYRPVSRWPTAKHFTSWLTLSPGCKISGGKVLSAHTRKTTNRVTAHASVGRRHRRTDRYGTGRLLPTAVGTYWQGQGRDRDGAEDRGPVLQRHALRHGLPRSRGDQYEQQYRDRVIKQLHRRAAHSASPCRRP